MPPPSIPLAPARSLPLSLPLVLRLPLPLPPPAPLTAVREGPIVELGTEAAA